MKRLLTIAILLTISQLTQGQEEKPAVKAIAKSWGDSITLRWAPTTPIAWKYANQHGYEISRITLKKNGRTLYHHEIERKRLAEVRVASENEFANYIDSNDYVGIAAQAILGESFDLEQYGEGPLAIYNQAKELENRYSFTLFSADQDMLTARLSGLTFTDKYVNTGDQYLYVINSLVPNQRLVIDTGYALIATDDRIELGAPQGLIATFGDHNVQLQWNKPQVKNPFTGYIIERSVDGKKYHPVNSQPFIGAENKSKSKFYFYLDSIPLNNQTYHYRIKGRSPFGELSKPSNVEKGKGGPQTQGEVPQLQNAKVIDNKKVYLHWTYPETLNKAIQGFAIYRSRGTNDPYQEITKGKLLSPTTRHWEDKKPYTNNYYQVGVVDKQVKIAKSIVVLAQLQDSIPPQAPIGMLGETQLNSTEDSKQTVNVRLQWKKNTEEDLKGYQVFRSYNPKAQYALVSKSITNDTSFVDSLPANTLNQAVYYQIIALDWNINKSNFSEPTQIVLPDQYPPAAPLFKQIISADTGVYLQWNHSHSKDLAYETLYRRENADSSWQAIKKFKLDSNWVNQFTDKMLNGKAHYQIRATDNNGLESQTEKYLTGSFIDKSQGEDIKITEVSPNMEGGFMLVRWKEPKQDLKNYELYRSTNDGPLRLLKILNKETVAIEDRVVEPDNNYSYRIRVIYADGRKSPLSKEMKNSY